MFDYLIFGEQLSGITMVGIVVVVIAVYWFQKLKPVQAKVNKI